MKNDSINKQGKKWFVFYVYVRPIIGVLLNIKTAMTYLNAYSKLSFYGQAYCIGSILIIIFNLIIWFIALGESKKLITLINYLLIYETIFIPMGYLMNENYSNIEAVFVYFLLTAIVALCWLWPNYIYFKKRKWIFQEDNDVIICKNCNNKIMKNETICPCCKSKININNNKKKKDKIILVCSNCKAKVNNNSKVCPECGEVFEDEIDTQKEIKKIQKQNAKKEKTKIDQMYSDLNKLKKLLDKDIISKEEFEKEKNKILK